MGLINLGAGLSAMGESIADTAGHMALEEQRSQLETQKIQLAESLRRGSQDREFAQQNAITDKEIKARKDIADSDARRTGDELQTVTTDDDDELVGITKLGGKRPLGLKKKAEPLTDVGKLRADRDAGRITQDQFDAAFSKATRESADNGEPLVEISDPSSPTGSKFVRRTDAVGKPGKPEKVDKLSVSDVIAPILQKMASGTELTPSENKAWDAYTKMDPVKRMIAQALGGADTGAGLTDDASGAPAAPKAAPAKAPTAKPPKPSEFPDAQWSDKAGAWVVQRNGKWNAIEQQ